MQKHTPGPWHIGMKPGPMLYGSRGEQVADMTAKLLPDEETIANARLIAAAPELLAALELIHANAAESPEWIRARIDPIIARIAGA